MKKLSRLLFAILGLILFLQTSITTVDAADKFKIKRYDANADILKNGDVDLTQRITYQFNGDFHGVYYNQDIKGKEMTTPQVFTSIGGQTKQLQESNSGSNDTYKVQKSSDAVNIKVYHTASYETVTFIYKYRLLGMVTNYLDTAELNWKMIGDGWDNSLNNIKLTVNLPAKNISQLQAWTHGPLNGDTKVDQKSGKVVMTLDYDPANTFVETHMIFPTAVTADNKNVVQKNAKPKILKQEKKLVEAANASRERKVWIYYIIMGIGLIVLLIILGNRLITLLKKPGNKHTIPTPLHHFFDEPKYKPSFAQVLLSKSDSVDSLALTADLLYEVGKRRMKIEKVGRTYEITALVPPTNEFFEFLINKVGNGSKVSLRQIKDYSQSYSHRKAGSKVDDQFDKWSKDAAKGREKYLDLKNMGIIDDFKMAAFAVSIIGFIMFIIAVIFGRDLLLVGGLMVVFAAIACGMFAYIVKTVPSYTDAGEIEVNQVRAFKRMLKDIDDIKMAEVGDLILWEQFLPYAVVFGVSDKVIKALKVNFSTQEIDQSMVIPFYIGSNAFVGSSVSGFQSAFTSSIGGSASSVSGGSGGFSGGSSGGFGGGSGGGAF